MRLTLIYPSVGRKENTPYVRAWQMEPLSMALLASLTPPGIDLRFYDDRLEEIPFDEPTFLEKSVDFADRDWRARYFAAKASATLHVAPNDLGSPQEGDPYERNNRWMLDSAFRFARMNHPTPVFDIEPALAAVGHGREELLSDLVERVCAGGPPQYQGVAATIRYFVATAAYRWVERVARLLANKKGLPAKAVR